MEIEPGEHIRLSETVAAIAQAHRARTASPEETVARSLARIRAYGDPAVFVTLRDEAEALGEASALGSDGEDRPLYGVPIAVKDNIDVAGLPTTAACPAFAYTAREDATVIARLKRAGAIIIGKTNLDQFATGLVGVRSPYGIPRNPFKPELIPGGSSSGSAVAVAAGLVPLALGTDTAGSGRVPAGLNNIVGLKPSLGLVSMAGVVPACRSLDCVSIFALTTDDAYAALAVMAGSDERDCYSRKLPFAVPGNLPPTLRIGVPSQRIFFGDKRAEWAFDTALDLIATLGATLVEIDPTPFLQAARLLYEGPWLAERWAAVGDFIAAYPNEVHPVTRKIITAGKTISAAEAFRAFDQLAELRRAAREALAEIDILMVPTVPAAYTLADIEADPVQLNSNLGTYTNFVNLLDLAGLAVPCALASDGTPFGVTFLASAGQDAYLASLGRVFHARSGLPLGALGLAQPALTPLSAAPLASEIAIAVVGAHLSGMPLNSELRDLGARFLERISTAANYRLYVLADTRPPKPGLLRVATGQGAAIEVEIWGLRTEEFGRFVAAVPSPLSIGTIELADGRTAKGFLVEAAAVADARDISSFGGWRAFLAAEKVPA
jgi:allophanate hydrolase